MAQKLDDREVVSIPEALQMEMVINQALIDLLIETGIITGQELMDRIEDIKAGIVMRGTEQKPGTLVRVLPDQERTSACWLSYREASSFQPLS